MTAKNEIQNLVDSTVRVRDIKSDIKVHPKTAQEMREKTRKRFKT